MLQSTLIAMALLALIGANIMANSNAFVQPNALVRYSPSLHSTNNDNDNTKAEANIETLKFREVFMPDRRSMVRKAGLNVAAALTLTSPQKSNAMSAKSRSEGYAVQRTEREWAYILSGQQYNILRVGGTERPNSSILEGEDRAGAFRCAACSTPLFTSASKFHSGTGWPSFGSPLEGVEVENVNAVQASLLGAEIRCGTCGGHLGDVFSDGMLYVNTPAFTSGKRYCVDGYALVFKPSNGGEDVFGDLAPPVKKQQMPDFLAPPKINAR